MSRPATIDEAENGLLAVRNVLRPAVATPEDDTAAAPTDGPANPFHFNLDFFSATARVLSFDPDAPYRPISVGTIFYNSVPYSTFGYSELCPLSTTICPHCSGQLDLIPDVFVLCPFW